MSVHSIMGNVSAASKIEETASTTVGDVDAVDVEPVRQQHQHEEKQKEYEYKDNTRQAKTGLRSSNL